MTELVKSIESLRKGRKNSVKWHAYQSVLNAIIPADCKHPKLLSERLVVSYDKVKLVSKKKSLIDEADDWSIGHDVKQRSDAFAVQYAAYLPVIGEWWESNTQQSPEQMKSLHKKGNHRIDKKNHVRVCIEHEDNESLNCEEHALHFQVYGDDESYRLFAQHHPGIASVCKQQMFVSRRPWWVCFPTPRTCECTYHTNFYLMHDAYKKLAREAHEDCTCDCDFCENGDGCKDHPCESTDAMMDYLFCKPGAHGYKLKCVKHDCTRCGWRHSNLDSCLASKFDKQKEVEWYEMKSVTVDTASATADDADAYGEKQKVKKETKELRCT